MIMLKINIGISAYKFTNKILIIADCTSFVGNSQPRFSILFKPNSWIGVDIQIIPWEVIEEDHDL